MWTTQEQLEFLLAEDEKWSIIKAGTSSLGSFYVRTAETFLAKWPIDFGTKTSTEGEGEEARKAREVAEAEELTAAKAKLVKVSSVPSHYMVPLILFDSVSPAGSTTGTTLQSQTHLPPNPFSTSLGRTRTSGRCCRNGRPSQPSTTTQWILHFMPR
jgi:hypothetical protein